MPRKSMIIIGAGIAGLSAGCYAQMNGYQTTVLEMHDKPGGLCTSWKRKGYTIDYCIHHLAGSSPDSGLYPLWQELGALRGQEMIFHDELVRVEGPDGKAFHVYTDLDRLYEHMVELSPQDQRLSADYVRAARRFTGMELFSLGLRKPLDAVRQVLPLSPALIKWGKINMQQYGDRFRDPFLRRAFPVIQYGITDVPVLINLNFLAWCSKMTMGWPKGGSLSFTRGIEKRYLELGGQVVYGTRVEKIIVENQRAAGVVTADGSRYDADLVISAADGHSTIFTMLEGNYTDERIRKYYAAAPENCGMSLQVAFGVKRMMSDEPQALAYFPEQPVAVAGKEFERLDVEIFNYDDSLAPAGKTVLKVLFETNLSYWLELAQDRPRYEEEKERIAETVKQCLESRFPGIAAQVEMTDVSTPYSVERYTGNWRGIIAPWLPPGGFGAAMKGFSRTLPGLDNFYMIGQWGEAMIGISTVALAARKIVKTICDTDGKRFTAFPPDKP